ncbi:MAG: hypothetical protein LPK19_04450, partial [Hymenobacteraceae bacterium]|nr:hypothetical protein [Hymenobacteraceae bacterium]MDX5395447.1 hypothetical protein [Hymenobacteraceae bacterium]MDX5511496.1 hypothetical protein [Hymenobacteraceae bacterium]
MRYHRTLLFLILILLSSCAKKHFYQSTALVNPAQQAHLQQDSVLAVAGKHYDKSKLHELLFGKHYRDIWATPIQVKVFNADTAFGGLRVTEKGGGMQTKSIKFKDQEAREYALRSIDKDPAKPLPAFWQKTFIATLLRDQTSAANPYGAFVLEPMAQAAGIFYTHPRLVYLKKEDPDVGEFAQEYGGQLMLLEERNEEKEAIIPEIHGENADDMMDTEDVLRKRFNSNEHQFDQVFFARNRLFDMLIGDWDRHEGQWQWIEYEKGKEHIYRPIPKDRDQAFNQFRDGIIPWLASRFFPGRKFTSFHYKIDDVEALLYNASFIDARALNEVTREQWIKLGQELKQSITDSIIEASIKQWPQPVYDQIGLETIAKLKSRRDQLPQVAEQVYEELAKDVMVIGSDEEEIFRILRKNDSETVVEMWRPENGKKPEKLLYSRTFYENETDEITIYGLGEDDKFEVSGKVKKGIKITLVGGLGEDEFTDESNVKGLCKHTII